MQLQNSVRVSTMIEFQRVLTENDVRHGLISIAGYREHFPRPNERITVYDDEGREYPTKMHSEVARIDGLRKWYKNHPAKIGDTISITILSHGRIRLSLKNLRGNNAPVAFKLNLKLGQEVSNERIMEIFRCGARGGMRRSKKTNSLVIISDHTKRFYSDEWQGSIIHYTGMGLTGDQKLAFQQNKTLAESDSNGVSVYLFEVFTMGKYTYQGQVKLAEKPYEKTQPDFKSNNRTVWIFPLRATNRKLPIIISEENFQKEQELKEKQTRQLSNRDLQDKLSKVKGKAAVQKVVCNRFIRNEFVAEFARRIADGKCQLCEQEAPFKKRNSVPYLEVHHIDWLSKGGKDVPENTVALCPNCHRKMHVLDLGQDKALLRSRANKQAGFGNATRV